MKIAYGIYEKLEISLEKIGYDETKVNLTEEFLKVIPLTIKEFLKNIISNLHQKKMELQIIHLK